MASRAAAANQSREATRARTLSKQRTAAHLAMPVHSSPHLDEISDDRINDVGERRRKLKGIKGSLVLSKPKRQRAEHNTRRTLIEGLRKCSFTLVYDALMRPLLLDPQASRLIAPWDACTASALLFTTFVTPFEVALLGSTEAPVLFAVNRFVDCIFIIDLVLQFVIMYQPSSAEAGIFEDRPTLIARHCENSTHARTHHEHRALSATLSDLSHLRATIRQRSPSLPAHMPPDRTTAQIYAPGSYSI